MKELDRAHDNGAVGVMELANIVGRHLTEDQRAAVAYENAERIFKL